MRLHRLELTAFGPFAETARVDFDELGADGLFLLHGHTGAGKTTVLDAIAFALYGRVPGARGESKRLHSDHADPHTPPRVVLEATLGGRRLRLTRSPEFERPKKRGVGTRIEQAAATLEWLDGRGQHLSRIPDIGDEVNRLLGMSADQFFQVVLLPQGDFARFLRSDNEDREKLLERLFDTERFGTAEQWLAQRRRDSAAQLDSHRQGVDRLIAQVAVTAGLGATETAGPLEAVEWSERLITEARAEAERAAAELRRCRELSAELVATADEQRRLRERRERAIQARRQLEEFAAGAAERARLQADLERARRVEPVAVALDEARTAAVALRRREDDVAELAERLAARLLEPESAELPGTSWAAADLASGELHGTETAEELSALCEPEAQDASSVDRAAASRSAPGPEAELSGDSAKLTDTLFEIVLDQPDAPVRVDEPVELELFSVTVTQAAEAAEASPTEGAVAPEGPGNEAVAAGDNDTDDSAPRGIDAAVQRWSAHIGSLEEIRSDAESAGRLSAELAELRTEYADATAQLARLTEHREQLPRAIATAEASLRTAADAKAALPGLERECERARAAVQAAVDLVRLRTELASAEAEFEQARAAHADARERTLDIRERRLAGMAAELAGALRPGQPCGVCGSTDHPAPAQPTDETVAESAEAEAVRAERAAEQVRDRILTRRTELERQVDLLIERGGDGDPADLAAALDAATERFRTARRDAVAADELTAEVARLRSAEAESNTRLRDLESRRSAVQERILAHDRRLAELTERMRVAAGADGTVERRRARLQGLIADASELRTARAEAIAARDRFADLARRVEQAARAADLPVAGSDTAGPSATPDTAALAAYAKDVAAVSRSAQQQAAMEAELVAADRQRAHAEAVLAEPEVRAAAEATPVDPAELEAAVAAARRALDAAVAAHADRTRRVAQLEELGSQLWAAADRLAPLERAHAELAELAEVVAGRGTNNRRMSLRSYVLAARLEEVAVAGSARLRRMSGGRYEFVHTDAAGPRGRRGGLGLDIRDDYTGAVRPAKTLSGGETFMASLSLALGLADVVAAESGGLVLDTLFIDEGFGSLDADTLDAVMGVLDELRSGGRVVGVVSHVDEMRQRIPSRLHVIREPDGSKLRTVVA